MSVKNKIKRFLQERGITAYQFRKEVGIAQRTAYDLYNNPEQLPSSTVLSKICDTYQVQPGEVLEWVPKSEKPDSEEGDFTQSLLNEPAEQYGLIKDKSQPKSQMQLLAQEEAA
ncbi:helix-turn-helix transcriptional regulator [Komarekiella sp. 'clone 1']|uniref:Helix-turn-helix transcriptional regulator n=1 Tax=Komarekiella delphini-convector SJRDD-AB1 TaxID=2593771 RepID=A0AA40VVN7_9NOST|nr:helix-turn-helix transcriptional regulator [Komarekiella delphini-convector SJRDD-AB1]